MILYLGLPYGRQNIDIYREFIGKLSLFLGRSEALVISLPPPPPTAQPVHVSKP